VKKVAIEDPADKAEDPQSTRRAVIAELTWAKLYTKTMNKDLGVITTVIASKPISKGPAMKKSARKLHDRLRSANRTVGEISDHAGIKPASDKEEDKS